LRKNQKLKTPIITPTTKAEKGEHDMRLTHDEILKKKLVNPSVLKQMEQVSLALYERGNEVCNKQGLILVDTKYEFGEYKGKLVLIDEIHTPDSSRYWYAESYSERFAAGQEPEYFDKEFLRLWYKQHSDPYKDKELPEAPPEMIEEMSKRYVRMYQQITGEKFVPGEQPALQRLERNLKQYAL